MNHLPPLLFAVSIVCLGCGLWLGCRDLRPLRTPRAKDRANLRIAVTCSLLLHALVLGGLLLFGEISPSAGPFLGVESSATRDDFQVFLASERDLLHNNAPGNKVRAPLQVAAPAPSAEPQSVQVGSRLPVSPRPTIITGARVKDLTDERAAREMGAQSTSPQARSADHDRSHETLALPEHVVELARAPALESSAERLERIASAPSSIQEAEPETLPIERKATSPPPRVITSAPVSLPAGSVVAIQSLDAGPRLFPSPGTVFAPRSVASSVEVQRAESRQGIALQEPERGKPGHVGQSSPSDPSPPTAASAPPPVGTLMPQLSGARIST